MVITLGPHKVEVKQTDKVGSACADCYFAHKGQSTRSCPTVEFNNTDSFSSRLLCTTIGNGQYTYFVEVN